MLDLAKGDHNKVSILPYLSGEDVAWFVRLEEEGTDNKLNTYISDGILEDQKDCPRQELGSGRCSFKGCYFSISIQVRM